MTEARSNRPKRLHYLNLKDLASLGVRRAVLFSAAFCGEDTWGGAPKGEGPPGCLPTHKGHTVVALLRTLVLSPDLSPPLTWRLTGLPLRLFIQGESEGDELALRSLGIFDDPVPFASSFQRVASGKSIGELITNPLGG